MAFPNTSLTDIVVSTLAHRSPEIADNASGNNALLAYLKKRGKVKPVSGGREIWQPFTFGDNANTSWYSGYDQLPVGPSDNISGAAYDWKQASTAVVASGRELRMNNGKEQVFDLLDTRMEVAESSIANLISEGLYSDGTANGSKQITGLGAAVPTTPTTGTYGGIDRSNSANAFWRSKYTGTGGAASASTIQGFLNTAWAAVTRGRDRPDLLVMDGNVWGAYLASLQALQRFTGTETANLGFPSVKFMDADVVLDSGIGGDATSNTCFMLNTRYLFFRPHADCNMVPLLPNRHAFNQDALAVILGWMGNLTTSGAQFQHRITFA